MKTKFTTQDIIDMGAELYDTGMFTRANIRKWLTTLIENGYTNNYSDNDVERLYDIIVG